MPNLSPSLFITLRQHENLNEGATSLYQTCQEFPQHHTILLPRHHTRLRIKVLRRGCYASRHVPLPVSFGNFHRVHINSTLKPTLSLADFDVVTTHLSLTHLAILGESPVFKTITSHPFSSLGMLELIPELHGDLIAAECEEFLAKAILFLDRPFASQEVDDSLSAAEKVVSVSPDAIWSVGLGDVVSTRSREQELRRVYSCQAVEHNR